MPRYALAFLMLLALRPAWAQDFKGVKEKPVVVQAPLAKLPVGECLSYSIEWLGFPVGKIQLSVLGVEEVNGRKAYHVLARSYPNSFIRKLYDVEYQVHSYIDVEHGYALRFHKERRMKQSFNHMLIDFDQVAGKATTNCWGGAEYVDFAKHGDKKPVFQPTDKIEKDAQDLLSCFFYFRFHPFAVGESYPANVYYDKNNWKMYMHPDRAFTREIRNKGIFPAVDVYLTSSLNDFIFGKSKFHVLLTADARRVPIEFKVGTALGPIRGIIEQVPADTK